MKNKEVILSKYLSLLACLHPALSRTTVGQLSRIATAILAMTGRVTMLSISRWTGPGGSYRTVQRFFSTVIPWGLVFWHFFRAHLWTPDDVYLIAGDECVVTKSGKYTHGLGPLLLQSLREGSARSGFLCAVAGQHQGAPLVSDEYRTSGQE